ncbi:MAG: hypothetical protein JRH10_03825 [Deltaproteobacteria bacterium]|nr:hypothetical protein [Deltaproteobacteria bacterium]MBW2444944.1 hypothetical protein [Deltaproteobacteria bacterium]
MPRPQRKKLGEILVEAGLIDDLQLRSALADQKRWGNRLGKTLVKLGFVEEEPLMRHLSRLMGYPVAEIQGRDVDVEVLALLPSDVAEKYRCLPLFIEDEGAARYLYLGMEEPANLDTLDALQLRTGYQICPVLIAFRDLDSGLRRFYDLSAEGADGSDDLDPAKGVVGPDCLRHGDEVLDAGAEAAAREPATRNPEESFQIGIDAAGLLQNDSDDAAAPLQSESESEPPAPTRLAGEVPTRRILQALTQVLVEKGVMTRDELVAQVKVLAERDNG